MTWLIVNIVPLVLYCLACYYTDSKFQLALAKLLTLGYCMVMLAVYVGLLVQVITDGWLSPTTLSAGSFFLPLVLAGMLHLEEAYCMMYMLVYLITIPSMYILLVIYSFFNMWNVSWGTREVAQKKTKAELEKEKQEEEERQKEMKKKKKEGLMGTLLDQFNLGGEKGDTASVDFSIGNVLRCMCFNHEDPLEPKKQLVKISSSLDELSRKMNKLESVSGASFGGPGSVRRKSSVRTIRKSLGSVPEGSAESTTMMQEESIQAEDDTSQDESDKESEPKVCRNDLENPYWIDDEGLKNGPVDYLSTSEINFWKDMIEKYLKPLEMTKKEKDSEAQSLKDYRDVMIFTFLMINALYIVSVLMLQVQAEIRIPWTIFSTLDVNGQDGTVFNMVYTKASEGLDATVRVTATYQELDMLGLFFLLAFSSVTLAQMVGMLFHRWQTLQHYISSTDLPIPWARDNTGPKDNVNDFNATGLALTRQMQAPDNEDEKKAHKGVMERRQTIAQLTSYQKKQGAKGGKELNLENEFRKRFQSIDLTNEKDPMIRRLSTRRGTLHALANRRDSFIDTKRKKSVAFVGESKGSSFSTMASSGVGGSFINEGYAEDSDFEEDDFSSSYRASEGGRNSLQFDFGVSESRL